MKVSLDKQTRFIWAILGRKNSPLTEPFEVYYEKLHAWLKYDAQYYAFCGHDKDIDEDGQPKFRHIHLLIVLPQDKKPRLSTVLNKISNCTDVPTVDIDVELADNVGSCVRYCIHRGYDDKYQYAISDLQTNLDEDELNAYLNEVGNITASYLITCIKINGCSSISIMKSIGLKSYMKYRNAIKDIIDEISQPF